VTDASSSFIAAPATSDDDDFLVEAILAAEQLPRHDGATMYEILLGVSRESCDEFFRFALNQDSKGHQLSRSSFIVIWVGATPVACCAAWVEATGSQQSGMSTAFLMAEFLGRETFKHRMRALRTISQSAPKRSTGTIQLETFYVARTFRGRGLVSRLIGEALQRRAESSSFPPPSAEISLLSENRAALGAYLRSGFRQVSRPPSVSSGFAELTGSIGYLQLRKELATHSTP
jgi:ribosomal protein S18 acetylase RimI-like enzyme